MSPETAQPHLKNSTERQKASASLISLSVGIFLLLLKFYAYRITGSRAVLSDAMESIVNVLAAAATLWVIWLSIKPADRDHPYGHGKVEFFSAVFEGGLLSFAGILIAVEAADAWFKGATLQRIDLGLGIVLGAGFLNLFLGLYLKKVGRRAHSLALEASGIHVVGDFWTSIAVVAGLLAVKFTGWMGIDAILALGLGVHLFITGVGILRRSVGGLLDAEDHNMIKELGKLFDQEAFPGIIRIHATRIIRSGSYHHIDAHVVLPEFWSISQGHDMTSHFEKKVMKKYPTDGEIHFHIDPCRQFYCRTCDLKDCPIRKEDFQKRIPFSLEELVSPEEPAEI